MKYIRAFVLVLMAGGIFNTQAQDTTWIQTLDFGDITKRRDKFQFPEEGDSYRKILMYYTLKCDASTTQDNFPCGEWDYLTYTNVYFPTGEIDSNALVHPKFKHGDKSPDTLYYVSNYGYDYIQGDLNTLEITDYANAQLATVADNLLGISEIFPLQDKTGRSQFLYLKSDLEAAGLTSGDIHEIRFKTNGVPGSVDRLKIRMKNVFSSDVDDIEGGTELVYDYPYTFTSNEDHAVTLSTPFTWNGNSALIVEFAFEGASGNAIEIRGESTTNNMGLSISKSNGAFHFKRDEFMEVDHDLELGVEDEITVSFWMFGDDTNPMNTSTFEATNENGGRVLNSHTPWGNSNVYWDAGNDGGSDRISKEQTDDKFKGKWNHYAFVKDAISGEMKVYINGAPRITGVNKNRTMAGIKNFIIGGGLTAPNRGYAGRIDEFRIFNAALERSTIQDWMYKSVDAGHPNYENLLHYFKFDEIDGFQATDEITGRKAQVFGKASWVNTTSDELFFGLDFLQKRPQLTFVQGDLPSSEISTSILDSVVFAQSRVVHYEVDPDLKGVSPSSESYIYARTSVKTYDLDGNVIDEQPLSTSMLINGELNYFSEPFDITETIEIGRYITPYGINLDLGPNGFTWVFDVTEYAPFLKGEVDLSAGNQQELIDLKFAFIAGTEPRDLLQMDQVWGPRRSYSYKNLDDDVSLPAVDVPLAPGSESWKLRARLTGHGHNSNDGSFPHCCEWKDNSHYLYVNGNEAANFKIFRYTECGVNPVFPQGGTWPGAREGWCPGDVVWNYDYEISDMVSGNSVNLDYDITPVPANNQGMGGGNYQAVFHLFHYGPAKFEHDAEIYDVLNPNDWEYYARSSNVCSAPKVVVRNNSDNPLTSLEFTYGVKDGNPETYNWTGNIGPWEMEEVELPIPGSDFWKGSGDNIFTVSIAKPNGSVDENSENDSYSTHFIRPDVLPNEVMIEIRTNNNPGDNSYKVYDATGAIVLSRSNMSANTTYTDILNLENGCYYLELLDSGQDGLSYWAYPEQGNGTFRIKTPSGSALKYFESEFGGKLTYSWQAGETLFIGDESYRQPSMELYPNPSPGKTWVRFNGATDVVNVEVLTMDGKSLKVFEGLNPGGIHALDLSGLPTGVYLIRSLNLGFVDRLIIE